MTARSMLVQQLESAAARLCALTKLPGLIGDADFQDTLVSFWQRGEDERLRPLVATMPDRLAAYNAAYIAWQTLRLFDEEGPDAALLFKLSFGGA